jgi:peptide chain release factor subunit 1
VYKCPDDQSSCNFRDEEDIVEELSRICESFSSTVELVSTDSSEGLMLLQAFGGIAAVLRYKYR